MDGKTLLVANYGRIFIPLVSEFCAVVQPDFLLVTFACWQNASKGKIICHTQITFWRKLLNYSLIWMKTVQEGTRDLWQGWSPLLLAWISPNFGCMVGFKFSVVTGSYGATKLHTVLCMYVYLLVCLPLFVSVYPPTKACPALCLIRLFRAPYPSILAYIDRHSEFTNSTAQKPAAPTRKPNARHRQVLFSNDRNLSTFWN